MGIFRGGWEYIYKDTTFGVFFPLPQLPQLSLSSLNSNTISSLFRWVNLSSLQPPSPSSSSSPQYPHRFFQPQSQRSHLWGEISRRRPFSPRPSTQRLLLSPLAPFPRPSSSGLLRPLPRPELRYTQSKSILF